MPRTRAPLPILFVRHARAEETHPLGDAARGLDGKGRIGFRDHARQLRRRTELRGILTSPLVRAVQTAEILAEIFGMAEVSVRGELGGEGDPAALLALAEELGPGFALVGHNPTMAGAAALVLGRTDAIRLRKGAVFAATRAPEGWSFAWLAEPGRPVKLTATDLD